MPVFNVFEFGAAGNGEQNDAPAIQSAINTCHAAGGGVVILPAGKVFKSGWIELKSNVELFLERGAILLASDRYADFENPYLRELNQSLDDERYIMTSERNLKMAFITAHDAENISITGGGTIDGNGRAYIAEDLPHIYRMKPDRPWTLFLIGVKNLSLKDIAIRDGALWTVRLSGCSDVIINAIRIYNDMKLPNSDGIDLDCCQNVRISDCFLAGGDDTICVKSTPGFTRYGTSENITVSGCTLVSTSSALVIGAEVRSTIRDLVFESCVIRSSHRGLSLNLTMGGSIENVIFSNIVMETRLFHDDWWGRGEPIYIKATPWTEFEDTGVIRNIRFSNIIAHSENGVLIYGWKPGLIDNIQFENVHIEISKWTKWPGGQLDLRPSRGPNNGYDHSIRHHPTSGFQFHNAGTVILRNCQVTWSGDLPDYFRHALQYHHIDQLVVDNFVGEAAFPERYPAIAED